MDPYERKQKVDKIKIVKIATKLTIGFVGSAMIGYTIKGEKLITAAAEAYLDKKTN